MKTQVFKNSETYNQGGTFTLVALIIFSAAVYAVAFNMRATLEKSHTINNSRTSASVIELPLTTAENIKAEQPATGANSVAAPYQEYLVPALEQTLNISDAVSIRFPEVESGESTADNFLTELKALANAKTNEAVKAYELQVSLFEFIKPEAEEPLKVGDLTEYLTVKETPDYFREDLKALGNAKVAEAVMVFELQASLKKFIEPEYEETLALESWMTDEKCWCHRIDREMAMANQPKSPTVKQ